MSAARQKRLDWVHDQLVRTPGYCFLSIRKLHLLLAARGYQPNWRTFARDLADLRTDTGRIPGIYDVSVMIATELSQRLSDPDAASGDKDRLIALLADRIWPRAAPIAVDDASAVREALDRELQGWDRITIERSHTDGDNSNQPDPDGDGDGDGV